MRRREFLATTAAAVTGGVLTTDRFARAADGDATCRTYASPQEAAKAPREKDMFVTALRVGIEGGKNDYLATVDVDPASPTYSKVVSRLPMPHTGDELHHFGWNACSSCHADPDHTRRYLIVPGLKSGRIYVIDAANPRDLVIIILERVNRTPSLIFRTAPDI